MHQFGSSSSEHNTAVSDSSISTISFDPATSKYTVTFAGKNIETTVTDNSSVVDKWIEEINSLYVEKSTVVGLDIEWKPHQIRHKSNKSATLQLCIDEKCLIVQLIHIGINLPLSLKNFLMDPKFIFVGVEVASDISKLGREYGLECGNSCDIRDLVNKEWPNGKFVHQRLGLKDLAFEVVGLSMKKPKHVCMSDWEVRVLSNEQIEYGCIDAYASYIIGHKLLMDGN